MTTPGNWYVSDAGDSVKFDLEGVGECVVFIDKARLGLDTSATWIVEWNDHMSHAFSIELARTVTP